jgi:hypothetical protein
MTDSPNRNVETPGHQPLPQRQEPGPIWDEYKYRHDLCWRLIFQITTAVVVISVIPYIEEDVASTLQRWIIALPVIGILLVLFGLARLRGEIELLDMVKTKHRELLWRNYGLRLRDETPRKVQPPPEASRDSEEGQPPAEASRDSEEGQPPAEASRDSEEGQPPPEKHHETPRKFNRHFRGFKNHVTWYLVSLALVGAVNVVVIWCLWLPSLSD